MFGHRKVASLSFPVLDDVAPFLRTHPRLSPEICASCDPANVECESECVTPLPLSRVHKEPVYMGVVYLYMRMVFYPVTFVTFVTPVHQTAERGGHSQDQGVSMSTFWCVCYSNTCKMCSAKQHGLRPLPLSPRTWGLGACVNRFSQCVRAA